MSGVRESDLMNSVRELSEMFPNHSPQTIEAVLRSKRGVIDSAISVLLETPEDAQGQQHAPPPPPARKHEGRKERPDKPKRRTGSIRHIFPPDFLRWPPDAQVICEDANGNRIERPSLAGIKKAPVPEEPEVRPVVRVEVQAPPTKEKGKGWWHKFRSRFRKKGNYERI